MVAREFARAGEERTECGAGGEWERREGRREGKRERSSGSFMADKNSLHSPTFCLGLITSSEPNFRLEGNEKLIMHRLFPTPPSLHARRVLEKGSGGRGREESGLGLGRHSGRALRSLRSPHSPKEQQPRSWAQMRMKRKNSAMPRVVLEKHQLVCACFRRATKSGSRWKEYLIASNMDTFAGARP